MPTSRATARTDRAAGPTVPSCARALARIARVRWSRARARAEVEAEVDGVLTNPSCLRKRATERDESGALAMMVEVWQAHAHNESTALEKDQETHMNENLS